MFIIIITFFIYLFIYNYCKVNQKEQTDNLSYEIKILFGKKSSTSLSRKNHLYNWTNYEQLKRKKKEKE